MDVLTVVLPVDDSDVDALVETVEDTELEADDDTEALCVLVPDVVNVVEADDDTDVVPVSD
jgi:hypothetical protein